MWCLSALFVGKLRGVEVVLVYKKEKRKEKKQALNDY